MLSAVDLLLTLANSQHPAKSDAQAWMLLTGCNETRALAAQPFRLKYQPGGRHLLAKAAPDALDASLRGAQNKAQSEFIARLRDQVKRSEAGNAHGWQPQLQPPAALDHFRVVLVAPRKFTTLGGCARILSSFECLNLTMVAPRISPHNRRSRADSKGAGYVLGDAQTVGTLAEAISDCTYSVAFARWTAESKRTVCRSIAEVCSLPPVCAALMATPLRAAPLGEQSQHDSTGSHSCARHSEGSGTGEEHRKPIALVFGRECEGLSSAEIAACDASCAIAQGRLQESLSLTHALAIVMHELFDQRLSHLPQDWQHQYHT